MRSIVPLGLMLALVTITIPASADAPADSTDRSSIVAFPALFYAPETGFGGGAAGMYFLRHAESEAERPSVLQAMVIGTTKRQASSVMTLDLYTPDRRWGLLAAAGFSYFPDRWYGIGPDTPDEAEEEFTPRMWTASLGGRRQLRDTFSLIGKLDWFDATLEKSDPGGSLELGLVPAARGGTTITASLGFEVDSRNHGFAPSAGTLSLVTLGVSDEALGSDHTFTTLNVDLRTYHSLGGDRVLALRGLYTATNGTSPWYLLPTLGGGELLRGYYGGRYRDRTRAALQSEVRTPLRGRVGAVVFAALGDVAPDPGELALSHTRWSAGFGLRVALSPEERVNLRFDFGFGEDTSDGPYIQFLETF